MTKNNNTLTYRVGKLEESTKDMNKKLDKIIDNELRHIRREQGRIREDVVVNKTLIKATAVINFGALILAAVLLKYL